MKQFNINSNIDLFSDEVLYNPYPAYKKLRDLGPAAYLARHNVYWLGRYDQVKQALKDWQTFSSAQGAGLNQVLNDAWNEALICTDPPKHTDMKKFFTDRLGPRHLKDIQDIIKQRTDELVADLCAKQTIDGIKDVAHILPINVIFDLIGWPAYARDKLLDCAIGSFNACGPESPRMLAALPKLAAMVEFVAHTYDNNQLTPGGFGSTIADAAKRGEITRDAAIGLLNGYIVAAFDTTINAIGNGLWLFSNHPEEWEKLTKNPELAGQAFAEIIRIETPLQHLARVTTRDVEYDDGTVIPKGARVIVSYAAANRDERHYPEPDTFDISRNPVDHLAFGLATHNCAGQGLAKLEGISVFSELAKQVKRFEITGAPEREPNSITRGLSYLPLRIAL